MATRIAVALLAATVLVTAGCGGGSVTAPPPAPVHGTVQGFVGTGPNGVTGLQGAAVSCGGYTVTSASGGFYTISNLPFGTHTIRASKAGYESASRQVTLTSSQRAVTVNLTLQPTNGNGGGETGYGTVAGRVFVTGTTTPVSGVRVACGGVSATTDQTGNYRLERVPAGDQTLSATKSDFERYETTVHVVADRFLNHTVYLTSSILTTSLSGTVTDFDTGEPVSDATVRVGFDFEDRTDANGHYQLPNVPQGDQLVRVDHPLYMGQSTRVYLYSAPKVFDVRLKTRIPRMDSIELAWETRYTYLQLSIDALAADHDCDLARPPDQYGRLDIQWRVAGEQISWSTPDYLSRVWSSYDAGCDLNRTGHLSLREESPNAPSTGSRIEVRARARDLDGHWSEWRVVSTTVAAYP